jgi:hypothetical protein
LRRAQVSCAVASPALRDRVTTAARQGQLADGRAARSHKTARRRPPNLPRRLLQHNRPQPDIQFGKRAVSRQFRLSIKIGRRRDPTV